MGGDRAAETAPKKAKASKHVSAHGYRLAPWLFHHQDLIHRPHSAEPVDQEDLTNRLNHIHFMRGNILVHLHYPRYEQSILVRACPEACLGKEVTCRWCDDISGIDLQACQFLHLAIDDGRSMILVPGVLQKIARDGLTVQLPSTSFAVGQRQVRRYPCHEVVVELVQSGFQATGELVDYSPVGFRARVRPEPSSSFRWLNSDALGAICLRRDQLILFSGICRFIRHQGQQHEREIVLAPVNKHVNRFKREQFRNPRQHLVPSPTVFFDHPLIKKRVQLEVCDISTSGFSVYEKADEGVLMPGMMLPELTIDFAGTSGLKCTAQVIYRSHAEEQSFRCGFSILDMDMNAYRCLTHMLSSALDPCAHISSEVDMDALWEFFFDTGFIYPRKYRLIQSHREDFKETYRRLYQESPEIATHFTYQKNGRIYGHISMVRAYERAWMIHHHAARVMDGKRPGFMVLMQILHYLNDLYRLPSAKIDYVFSCFRPENKFPDRVFGGFARALKNRRGSSLDIFSYLIYPTLSMGTRLPEGWLVQESSSVDLSELSLFYNHHSGGLLLDILRLGHRGSGDEALEDLYDRLGFMRRWRAYSLTHYGRLYAVLIVNQSNLGVNLSELLNSITILITDSEGLAWDILCAAINELTGVYQTERVPILIYPSDYLEATNIPYDTKKYLLWIYDARLIRQFTEFLHHKFRINYK